MLKEIIFCLKYQTDVRISAEISEAASYLRDEGFSVRVVYPEKEDWVKERFLLKVTEGCEEECLGDILFLTDSDRFTEFLLLSGAYVVGIKHEGNAQENFAGLKYVFTDIEDVDVDSYIKAYQRYAHLPWKILETKRCIIRETTVEDVDTFYEIYADPEMTRYMEGLFADPEDEKKYTRDYIEKVYGLVGFGVWTVLLKSTGEIIGRAGFSIRNGFENVELGFLIGTEYQRCGYAYEVCSAILDYGKNVLQFPKVQVFVKAQNKVSIHLCKKLGFDTFDEVDIEENIYGDEYGEGQRVAQSEVQHGKYVRMVLMY